MSNGDIADDLKLLKLLESLLIFSFVFSDIFEIGEVITFEFSTRGDDITGTVPRLYKHPRVLS